MIDGEKPSLPQNDKIALDSVGFYRSPPGGAAHSARIPRNRILFEMITEGAVYAPDGDTLHGVGAVFAHRPGQETVTRTEGNGHYACLTAQFYLSRIKNGVDWPRCFSWEDEQAALRFAEEMLLAYHQTSQDREIIGDLIWSRLRFEFDRYQRRPVARGIPPRLAVVLAEIERHYANPLGIEALGQRIGISASHLHAEFREHLKITPHQHLIGQRMRAAQHKLATTADPIKVVAQNVGYTNTENFCRAFKRHSGYTAANYRRKYQSAV